MAAVVIVIHQRKQGVIELLPLLVMIELPIVLSRS